MAESFIDSSVLVGFFNEEDVLHQKALSLLESIEKPLLIHEYVALETTTLLMVRSGKPIADEFLRVLLGNADFKIVFSSEANFLLTSEVFAKNKTKLSFTDAALLELSSTYPVLTFDEALMRAIKKRKSI